MTRRRLPRPATVARIVLALVLVLALGLLLRWLRDSAPVVTLDPVAPALAPDDPDLVTCERTLPDDPEAREDAERVRVLGRVAASEVIECPDAFDQRVVEYLGEVVGDVLDRDGGAWLLVNDDAYALEMGPLSGHRTFAGGNTGLAVWVPDPVPDLTAGAHDRRGSIVLVRGRIHRSDPEDGGGLTLRALSGDDVEVVRASDPVRPPIHRRQAVVAIVFMAAALAITIRARQAAQRR